MTVDFIHCRQLQQPTTPCVSTPHNQLANPLSFLHDHPYSKMKNYAKKVSTKMPSQVLLHWNSVPQVTINGIASRKQTCSNAVGTQDRERDTTIRRATVEVEPKPHTRAHSDLLYPCFVPGADRAAKFLAHLRMRADLEELDRVKHRRSNRSRSQEPRSRKRVRSLSPLVQKPGKGKTASPRKSGLVTSELGREARGGSVPAIQEVGLRPPQEVPLKILSVDLQRFPVVSKVDNLLEENSEDSDVIVID